MCCRSEYGPFESKASRPLEAAASLEPAYGWRGLATVSRAGTAPGLCLAPYTPFADTLTSVEEDVTMPLVTTLIFYSFKALWLLNVPSTLMLRDTAFCARLRLRVSYYSQKGRQLFA